MKNQLFALFHQGKPQQRKKQVMKGAGEDNERERRVFGKRI